MLQRFGLGVHPGRAVEGGVRRQDQRHVTLGQPLRLAEPRHHLVPGLGLSTARWLQKTLSDGSTLAPPRKDRDGRLGRDKFYPARWVTRDIPENAARRISIGDRLNERPPRLSRIRYPIGAGNPVFSHPGCASRRFFGVSDASHGSLASDKAYSHPVFLIVARRDLTRIRLGVRASDKV